MTDININEIDYFESIISILDKLPNYKHIDALRKETKYLIEYFNQNQDYDREKFFDFANDFIWLVISMGAVKKYIEKISLLCIIHWEVKDIYLKFNIYLDVSKYFYENWEIYAKDTNVTVSDFLFHYGIHHYLELINKGMELEYISDQIKNDKYLSSSYGFYTRKAVILWLYSNVLSRKENGLDFLEPFKNDDDTVRKKIDSVRIRNSKATTKSA
jgi:hypothetical protein